MSRGSFTLDEITSQPEVWESTLAGFSEGREALSSFLDQATFEQVLAIGCGSTHYLSMVAASLVTHHTGLPAYAMPSSQVWLFPDSVPAKRTLLLPISRSGTTTETLLALKRFREVMEGTALTVTCYPEELLAVRSDYVLAAPDAQERSVAQTRSFASMLLLAEALAVHMGQDEDALRQMGSLPDTLDRLMRAYGDLVTRVGEDLSISRIFFLGNAPLYGIACEAMLKMKEMSITYVEPYHFLEFRHGPMSMVSSETLVVGFVSDSAGEQEVRVLRDMEQLGARTLAIVESRDTLEGWQPDYLVELGSGLGEWVRVPLYLPLMQLMAFHRSMAKGLDPDNPQNLSAVIELDEEI